MATVERLEQRLLQAQSVAAEVTILAQRLESLCKKPFPCTIQGGDSDVASNASLSEVDPRPTERQKELAWYYKTFGVLGLALVVKQVAEEEKNKDASHGMGLKRKRPSRSYQDDSYEDTTSEAISSTVELGDGGHISWHKVLADHKLGGASRALFYISSLHPKVITALIDGNLPRKMQDPEFAAEIGPQVTPREAPGTYSLYVASSSPTRNTQPQPDAATRVGLGLTLRHLLKVADAMRRYINVHDGAFLKRAMEIDQQTGNWTPDGLDYRRQRRYGESSAKDNFRSHQFWLDNMDELFLKWARSLQGTEHEHLLDIAPERCVPFIGLDVNALGLATGHWSQGPYESPIFGLFTALVKFLFKDDYSVEDFTYQIIKTTRTQDIGLTEIVTSIIASSFPWDGGLNFTYAGVSLGNTNSWAEPGYLQRLRENAESIQRSGNLRINVQDAREKIKKVEELLQPKVNQALIETHQRLAREVLDKVESKVKLVKTSSRLVNLALLSKLQTARKEKAAQR